MTTMRKNFHVAIVLIIDNFDQFVDAIFFHIDRARDIQDTFLYSKRERRRMNIASAWMTTRE